MKTKPNYLSRFALILMAFSFFLISCEKDDMRKDVKGKAGGFANFGIEYPFESSPESDGGVTPWVIDGANRGGNRTCAEVSAHFENEGYEFEFVMTSGKFDYEYNKDEGKWEWIDEDGNVYDEDDFPFEGLTVTVTDGTFVEFHWDWPGICVGAVIVKGSNDANVYFYDVGVKSDSGLASPVNASGKSAGLSNITFCFVECDDNGNGGCETAFAYGCGTFDHCFIEGSPYRNIYDDIEGFEPDLNEQRWGWTNGPIEPRDGDYHWPIWAGAGQCDKTKGTEVGLLLARYLENSDGSFTLRVRYYTDRKISFDHPIEIITIDPPFTMTETHLYVGYDPLPIHPQTGKHTVAPGQYPYKNVHDNVSFFEYTIDGLNGDPLWIIAHAVVCGL